MVLWLRTMHWLLEALSEISLTRSLRREAICPERGPCSLLWCDGFPWYAFSIEALCSVHFILYFQLLSVVTGIRGTISRSAPVALDTTLPPFIIIN